MVRLSSSIAPRIASPVAGSPPLAPNSSTAAAHQASALHVAPPGESLRRLQRQPFQKELAAREVGQRGYVDDGVYLAKLLVDTALPLMNSPDPRQREQASRLFFQAGEKLERAHPDIAVAFKQGAAQMTSDSGLARGFGYMQLDFAIRELRSL